MSRHEVDTSLNFSGEAYVGSASDPGDSKVRCNGQRPQTHTQADNRTKAYMPDSNLVEAVNLSIALGRPLLLQGEPGCGKTRLAYAVAYGLGLPLEEGYIKSTTRAQDLLYTYEAVNRLYDAQF